MTIVLVGNKHNKTMTYETAISQAPVVLIEFYASWCPHCQGMMPIVDQVKELLDGDVPVIQLDVDNNKELSKQENIESIPTFIVYKDGREAWRHSGEIDGNALLAKVQSYQ
jgi:thioredoxin 1